MTRDEIIKFAKKHDIELSVTWWDEDGEIWLNKIITPENERGNGLGGEIIEKLKQYCDENHLVMKLLADSCYGTEIKRLISYYKKHGFESYKEGRSRSLYYLKYTPEDMK